MGGNSKVSIVFLFLIIWLADTPIEAQQKHSASSKPASRARRVWVTGLRTERLSKAELRYWEKMKDIIFSTDYTGRPWHTTLVQLWTQLEDSGHTVYVELKANNNPNNSLGGVFRIEQFDPRGVRHIAVVRLYLTNIERAQVGPAAARPNGFIPFEYLSREERYVAVFGHELAHAAWILSDLNRAAKVTEMIEQTNELFLLRRGQVDTDPVFRQRLFERDVLIEELEMQAEAVEGTVWQELMRSKGERIRMSKTKLKMRGQNIQSLQVQAIPPQP